MKIPVIIPVDDHSTAIEQGFAPWNIYRFFKYKDTVVQLLGVSYKNSRVYVVFGAGGVEFEKEIDNLDLIECKFKLMDIIK